MTHPFIKSVTFVPDHPVFRRGQEVTIYNHRYPSGEMFVEGRATLVRRLSLDEDGERWTVHFLSDHDTSTYERWVPHGKAQSDPEAYLASCAA